MGSTNGYAPTVPAQVGYIIQWFHEWSEMQRNDFLPILAQKFGSKGYVNGLLPGMENIANLDDRPPSLFQCRIKLFREWSEGWGQTEKDRLLSYIKEIDPGFLAKYEEELKLEERKIHPLLSQNDQGNEAEKCDE